MSNITQQEIEKLAIENNKIGWGQLFLKGEDTPYGEFLAKRPYPIKFWRQIDFWIDGYKAALQNKVSDVSVEEDNVGLNDFQQRVYKWLLACFGEEISSDKIERNHRFLEESLELVQSLGCTKSEAHQLVDYTFNRPTGEPKQEVGGVIVTLSALCSANRIDLEECGETELSRIWTKVDKIREKQANKPKHSPLPESQPKQKEESEKELEERTERNMNVISDFCEHVKNEIALYIPESAILSFFNA